MIVFVWVRGKSYQIDLALRVLFERCNDRGGFDCLVIGLLV